MTKKKEMPRGLRNNNPGNIQKSNNKWLGMAREQKDARFVTFETMAYGYRALFVLLNTYITKQGRRTVPSIISRYAPTNENNTEMYVASVMNQMGVTAMQDIDPFNEEQMKALARAITRVENGRAWLEIDIDDGWKMYLHRFGR